MGVRFCPPGARKAGPIYLHKRKYQIMALDGEFVPIAVIARVAEGGIIPPSALMTSRQLVANWQLADALAGGRDRLLQPT